MPKSKTIHVKERSKTAGKLIAAAKDYTKLAQQESLTNLITRLRVEQLEVDIRIAELQFTKRVLERDEQLAVNEKIAYLDAERDQECAGRKP